MAKIGSFGAAAREFDPDIERDTFDFFDQEFVVEGVIPAMLNLQMGAALTGKIDEMEGNAAVWQALRCALSKPEHRVGDVTIPADEAQFERFYGLAVARNCELNELLKLALSLFGAQAGKAREQQPTSPDGPQPTSTSSSSPASDSPDSHRLKSVDEVLTGSSG
jgi:hypothetical protein